MEEEGISREGDNGVKRGKMIDGVEVVEDGMRNVIGIREGSIRIRSRLAI
jgi:hypothetical protein